MSAITNLNTRADGTGHYPAPGHHLTAPDLVFHNDWELEDSPEPDNIPARVPVPQGDFDFQRGPVEASQAGPSVAANENGTEGIAPEKFEGFETVALRNGAFGYRVFPITI